MNVPCKVKVFALYDFKYFMIQFSQNELSSAVFPIQYLEDSLTFDIVEKRSFESF